MRDRTFHSTSVNLQVWDKLGDRAVAVWRTTISSRGAHVIIETSVRYKGYGSPIPCSLLMLMFYPFRFDKGIMESAWVRLSAFFWLFFATAYTTPAKNPKPMADTDPSVTISPKNIIPDAATGNLLSAPTILRYGVRWVSAPWDIAVNTHLYVVLLVVRIHHAVVYDMPTAAAPENAMANSKKVRVSDGLYVQNGWVFYKNGESDYDWLTNCEQRCPNSSLLQRSIRRQGRVLTIHCCKTSSPSPRSLSLWCVSAWPRPEGIQVTVNAWTERYSEKLSRMPHSPGSSTASTYTQCSVFAPCWIQVLDLRQDPERWLL